MCKCTPNIRTPWCGKPGCEMPKQKPPSVFGFPIKTFQDSKDMQKMMLEAEDGTLFLVGENVYKFSEGEDGVELVWAKIFKTRD